MLLFFGILFNAQAHEDITSNQLQHSLSGRFFRLACPSSLECRSKWGFCGKGPEYCGDGCQGGPCTAGNIACPDSTECRSKWGFCGKGSEYCGEGCLSGPCMGSSGNGDGVTTFQGKATYYIVSSGNTACGTRHGDNEYIAALNGAQFDPHTPNGNPNRNTLCNKLAKVVGPKGSITVKVVDKCPGCRYGDLDLSRAAFQAAVGNLGIGIASITWNWI
ncbi:unnamed protein product [Rotaria sp. Silwood1]|nr:unnamed protein product [Rotaria sp. Silwood1]CAF5004351.1 unnamed protein product [Rotaria sp. Silwood1]CAF5030288.1 unnamed protein product [Rotaria sp. Silwood1]